MDILLTVEERKAAAGTALIELDYSQPHNLDEVEDEAICRAQLRKVVDEVDRMSCFAYGDDGQVYVHIKIEHWQALREAAGEGK